VEHSVIDPLVTMRAIHFASAVMVAGAALFVCIVADPAFRAIADSPLQVIRPFRARLSVLFVASLAVAVASGAGWLLLLAAGIGDQPLSEAFTNGTAWVLLTETRFGIDWQLRLLLAVLLSAYVLLKPRSPSRWRDLVAALVGISFLATLAWAGHGGATPGSAGYVHLAADVLHLGAAGAWLGGLIPLALLLRLLRNSDEPGWATIAYEVTRRFSNLGIIAVGTLLISGMTNAWFLVGGTASLISTDYGRLLQVKVALFVGMVCLAAANRLHLMPLLSRVELKSEVVRRLERNALLEISIGLVIICIVGVLGVTPPAAEAHVHLH
jgi:putative copper resistance protein D